MKGVWIVRIAVCVLLLILVAPVAVTTGADGERLSDEAIVELVREGRNREAIQAFEALPEEARDSLHLLRAVADSYWREREFESAQMLYSEILKRRPTLQGLVPADQPAGPGGVPLPATLHVVPAAESGEGTMDLAAVPPVADLPVADAANAEAWATAGVDAMLGQLRREYLEIQDLARQREVQLQTRLSALQSDSETVLETLNMQHQAREQALAAQVSSLEQTAESMRAEWAKALAALQAQHQAREQVLAAQVNNLEQTVEAMHVEWAKERAALSAQVEASPASETRSTQAESPIVSQLGYAYVPVSRLMIMAGDYRDQRNFEVACELYERVLEAQPDDVDAKRKLVMTLFDMQRYDDALDHLVGENHPDIPQDK